MAPLMVRSDWRLAVAQLLGEGAAQSGRRSGAPACWRASLRWRWMAGEPIDGDRVGVGTRAAPGLAAAWRMDAEGTGDGIWADDHQSPVGHLGL